MSTDDFETLLRARLTDLADREDDWADPLPEARRRAALLPPDDGATDLVDDGPADDGPVAVGAGSASHRRRLLPTLAVAATVVALLVGGGFGLRALTTSDSGGSSSGSAAYGESDSGATIAPRPATPVSGASLPASGSGVAGGSKGGANSSCALGPAATSSGALATVASIRPAGVAGATTSPGGDVSIPYQVAFASAAGTAQFRAARAALVVDGTVCAATGQATPGVISTVTVAPGSPVSGSAVFTALDRDGNPLPAGRYQVAVVIPYDVAGDKHVALWQLVSDPVAVTVS